uniref:Uncharacterized protein n=1 Tax=Magallana gigas TaxID=29159 RepID=A0A8W8JPA6_MAGGI
MLTQCPGLLSCGAIYPVWMNGTNRSQSDGVIPARGFNGCCSTPYDVKVWFIHCLLPQTTGKLSSPLL